MIQSDVVTVEAAQAAIDAKTKPVGALGGIETLAIRLAVLQNTLTPSIEHARVCVFGADHGIALEGVSAYPRSVTAEMMRTFARGRAAINVLARSGGMSVEVIDVGVDADLSELAELRHARVRRGSRNMLNEPAMAEEEFRAALEVGRAAAKRAAHDGIHALGLGEMGIGNTASAAAVLSGLTGLSVEQTVGRGTGVDDAGLARKQSIVERAIVRHRPAFMKGDNRIQAREVLRCLGGLELAAIAGAAMEAAHQRIAIVADGFISTVAVLAALRITADSAEEQELPQLARSIFFAHSGSELGHGASLAACAAVDGVDARPILALALRLGEGSGAALAIPLMRAAADVMREMATFADAGVSSASPLAE
ncbi:MAG: nicotinate-nucleotide--dimethylbenzimidazole phosphoribosyltransferase [bacterium]